ncbi:MAG: hypothetical protein LN573_04750 [Rickettsia endosymbiont of Oxypoda opaca]|nr:hypothetical protein [Rickettsia endosymbiont of Oxypoda opaca]
MFNWIATLLLVARNDGLGIHATTQVQARHDTERFAKIRSTQQRHFTMTVTGFFRLSLN